MSYLGRNIKKIRTAKNISQAVFADLFNLSRASIGAYEEGRAEAKIDTIIDIADQFQLSLDQLLKKELTLNDIYHISEKSRKLALESQSARPEIEIPLIGITEQNEFKKKYTNQTYLQGLPTIKLPGMQKDSIAFEFSFSNGLNAVTGIKPGDILVAKKVQAREIDKTIKTQVCVFIVANELTTGRIECYDDGLLKFLNYHRLSTDSVDINSIKALWTVYRVISSEIPKAESIETRLQNIENQLRRITRLK